MANFWPVDARRYLLTPHNLAGRQRAVATFSSADAERLPAYEAALHRAATLLREVALERPPNAASILATQVLTPLDLERRFSLPDGDIFHGRLSPGQLYSARPVTGFANYGMPLRGFYLCGAGAHPGGDVSGLPGRNAAIEIIQDFKAKVRMPRV